MRKLSMADRIALHSSAPDECWLWEGNTGPKGYGKCGVRVHGIMYRSPHRAAYALAFGGIPAGTEIDHTCRVRRCFNPRHLEAVGHRENVMRGNTIAAGHAALTQCKRGHELVPKSGKYGLPPFNHRYCPTCARITGRKAVSEWRKRKLQEDPVAYAAARKRYRNPERERELEARRKADPVKQARRRDLARARYQAKKAHQPRAM